MDHPNVIETPNDDEIIKRSLRNKTLLELSELYRSIHWNVPKPHRARRIFWLKYAHRQFCHQNEASLKNDDGFYPLHLLRRDPGNISLMYTPDFIIHNLVELYPQATAFRDLNGVFPYTYIFNEWPEVPDTIIESILDVDPKVWFTVFGKIRKPSILSMIAMKHPTILKERIHDHSIPLHTAAKLIWSHRDVFDLLLQQGKKFNVGGTKGLGGLLMKDKRGITPLDCVLTSSFASTSRKPASGKKIVQHPVDWDWVWELLMSTCRYHLGHVSCTPLHSAIELGCSKSIIRLIMEKRPEDVRALDCRGMTPLAVASSKDNTSNLVIDALLHSHHCSYPEASSIADNNGNLPLHLALESHTSDQQIRWDIFQWIIESAPECIQIPNRSHMYPFMIAAVNDLNSLDTIYVLLRNAPFLIHVRNND